MRKVLVVTATAGILFAGCGVTGKPVGLLYTDVTTPELLTHSSGSNKEGKTSCKSILSLVAIGDCSIATAAKNGGITQVQSVDTRVDSILGIINSYTTIVKGN